MKRALLLLIIVAAGCPTSQPELEGTPEPTPTPLAQHVHVESTTLVEGDAVGYLLQGMGVSWDTINAAIEASTKADWNLVTGAKPGDRISVQLDGAGQVVKITAQRRPDRRLVMTPGPDEWTAQWDEPEYEIRALTYEGTIESSFWADVIDAGLDAATVQNLISIFDWQVDFFRFQKGDRFRVVMEAKFLNDTPRGFGEILGGRIQRGERDAYVVRYTPPDGKPGYYDLEGGSNKRLFLASAVDYARVSSSFSRGRYHPVLKVRRAHKGTDYAARTGTSVRSIGAGTVVFAGTKGGYGKHVRIRHKSPYESSYSHLNSIQVRVGQEIEQGQTLGTVGATGLATGPHLHFEFYVGGNQVNWEKQEFPAADPLEPEMLPLYAPIRDAMAQRLADESFPPSATAEAGK